MSNPLFFFWVMEMGAHCEGRAAKPRGTRVEANLSSFLPLICTNSFYCSFHVALRKEGQFGNWWFLGVADHQMTSPLACFVFLTIIRFKYLFNLYKYSFRQTNAKCLSVCQYRQIHWQILTWLSKSSTDMNRQTDNWQILSVCQYRQIHWQILT